MEDPETEALDDRRDGASQKRNGGARETGKPGENLIYRVYQIIGQILTLHLVYKVYQRNGQILILRLNLTSCASGNFFIQVALAICAFMRDFDYAQTLKLKIRR